MHAPTHEENTFFDSNAFQVNITDKSDELDVLLGHRDFLFSKYSRNNIKLRGGWYYRNIKSNTDFIINVINRYGIRKLNFIGSSKSCTGAVIFTKELLKVRPELQCNLFLFSAYTTVDKDVHIKRKIDSFAPDTLKSFWESDRYTATAIKRMETKTLENLENVNLYLFYPEKTHRGEDILAKRVQGSNVFHIGLSVGMHNTLFPLWKKVDQERKVEIYESEFRTLSNDDYTFYSKMQSYKGYNFTLYSCLENPKAFLRHFENFKQSFKRYHDRKNGIVISDRVIIDRERTTLGKPVSIYGTSNIRPNTKIGGFTFINGGTTLFQRAEIGRYCSIGKNCEIGAGNHPLNWLSTSPVQYGIGIQFPSQKGACKQFSTGEIGSPTLIGNDVWIGSLCLIKRGVQIGDGAVVAGGAVVVKDVPPYAIVGGVPAKIIRYRFDKKTIKTLLELKWWELDAEELDGVTFNDIHTAIAQIKRIKQAKTPSPE